MKSWLAFLADLMRSLATAQLARGSTWVCARGVRAFAPHPSSASGFNWEEVEDIRFPFPAEGQGAGGTSPPWSLTSQLWKTSLREVTDLSMAQGFHHWQKQEGTGKCPLGSLNGQPPPLLTLPRHDSGLPRVSTFKSTRVSNWVGSFFRRVFPTF